jgi:Rieske Fe-S protein
VPISRRATLAGAAVAGVPLLAACGDDGSTPGATSTDSGTPTPSPTPSPSEKPGPTRSAKPVESLTAVSDVPVGGGRVLEDEVLVVTQPAKGEFRCFAATCTHRGCVVGGVDGGTINCPCPGSRFSIEDGSVVTGPATADLPSLEVSVQAGQVIRA